MPAATLICRAWVRSSGSSRLMKLLRLDRPHHHITSQAGIGYGQCAYPILLLQTLPRGRTRIHHRDLLRRYALLAQATQYGAPHIAPPPMKNDVFFYLPHVRTPLPFDLIGPALCLPPCVARRRGAPWIHVLCGMNVCAFGTLTHPSERGLPRQPFLYLFLMAPLLC